MLQLLELLQLVLLLVPNSFVRCVSLPEAVLLCPVSCNERKVTDGIVSNEKK